ncbi:hypothetical protein CR970_03990 [Candidatus Saccharibacteria bacterium]|nr:MAG: hypothetical protein CR970_03990 [Candidatus Saccharibacteria bacterium]
MFISRIIISNMQSVADRWYISFDRFTLVIATAVLGTWLATLFMDGGDVYRHKLGLTYTIIFIIIVHYIYRFTLHRYIQQHHGLPLASTITALINSLGILSLMQATGDSGSGYILLWGILMLVSGMFGVYAIIAGVFMMTAYMVIITSDALANDKLFHLFIFLPVAITYLSAAASYYLWRDNYVDAESERVAKLSGMLRNKQQQSAILIESIADGVIVTSVDGQISQMNTAAATMTGWNIDEALGLDISLVVKLKQERGADLEKSQNPFMVALKNRAPAHANLLLVGKNDKQTLISIVTSPVTVNENEQPRGVVAIMRDVSVSRKEEQQRADFISTASHEMRTPVAAIEGYLALALNERVAKIDPKARGFLEKAHESTQHLGKLFQDLLTSAKAEDGRLASHPSVVELGSYVEQLTDSFKFAAQKKGLLADFIIGVPDAAKNKGAAGQQNLLKPLYYVYVDPDRLREVITNLFDNAVKYTPNGKISLGLTGNEEVVQLFVRDTGPGIPKEDIPHLFQKFYRVDNSATRTIGGTGLGLFICRKIVELYHGHIWADSELGKGSTFYINLPRLPQQKATEMMQQESQSQEPAPVTSLASPVL